MQPLRTGQIAGIGPVCGRCASLLGIGLGPAPRCRRWRLLQQLAIFALQCTAGRGHCTARVLGPQFRLAPMAQSVETRSSHQPVHQPLHGRSLFAVSGHHEMVAFTSDRDRMHPNQSIRLQRWRAERVAS